MKTPIALLLTAVALWAQQTPSGHSATPQVVAHGEGVVTAQPDQVSIQIGVTTQANTAQEAGAANAKQSAAVIAELKQQFGNTAEYKTMNYSLYPLYKSQRDGGKPTISGYQANNTVEVKSKDVSIAGKLVDIATRSGANQIQGIHFSLQNEQKTRGQALAQAAQQARANAEALATAIGARVVRVVRVEDGQPVHVMPMRKEMMAMAADNVQTPMEAGTIEVRATVTLTAEIAQ